MITTKVPFHQRFKPLGWIRRRLRSTLFALLGKLSRTDDARELATAMLRGLVEPRPDLLTSDPSSAQPPYPDLGRPQLHEETSQRADIIIITARFRTGSTLLWNVFRNLPGFTSYYEPLNERRWFDPRTRGERMDSTHRNVGEPYWREYEGLDELGNYYRESWICRNLLMDAHLWDPDLKRYVELLVEKAPGRPVLQFNRIDFRLPWFRRCFPNARLVHLYRHPRDQWCSSLVDPKAFPRDGSLADFRLHDHYYLLAWARDLKHHFPFLDERAARHPYQLFYYIWKLSYLFGRRYAHYSLAFEDLVAEPAARLGEVFAVLDVASTDLERLSRLVVPTALGKWKEYADADWFRSHEETCETVLAEFLGPGGPASSSRAGPAVPDGTALASSSPP